MPLNALSYALGRPSFGGGLFQVGQQAGQQGSFAGQNEALQRQQGAERSYLGLLKAGEEGVAGQVASQYNINPQRMEQMQEQFNQQKNRERLTAIQEERLAIAKQNAKNSQMLFEQQQEAEEVAKAGQKVSSAVYTLMNKDEVSEEFVSKYIKSLPPELQEAAISTRNNTLEAAAQLRDWKEQAEPLSDSQLAAIEKELGEDAIKAFKRNGKVVPAAKGKLLDLYKQALGNRLSAEAYANVKTAKLTVPSGTMIKTAIEAVESADGGRFSNSNIPNNMYESIGAKVAQDFVDGNSNAFSPVHIRSVYESMISSKGKEDTPESKEGSVSVLPEHENLTAEEARKLPKGTWFTGTDGKRRQRNG